MTRWRCELCDQLVGGYGPWCELYCTERRVPCLAIVLEARAAALNNGHDRTAEKLEALLDANWEWRDLL